MPRIIENLKTDLLSAAKNILLTQGYKALTIRRVAAECDVAVGTVYNYFASKDIMTAYVMMEDWSECMKETAEHLNASSSMMDGMKKIYEGIMRFTGIYEKVWYEYGSIAGLPGRYHHQLILEISEYVSTVLSLYHAEPQPDPSAFIAEILLRAGTSKDISFESMEPFLEKLCR